MVSKLFFDVIISISRQNVDFYVAEDLPGQGLLQRIRQRDVVLMNGKDPGLQNFDFNNDPTPS